MKAQEIFQGTFKLISIVGQVLYLRLLCRLLLDQLLTGLLVLLSPVPFFIAV